MQNKDTLLNKINSILSMAITASDTVETPIQTVQLKGLADEVLEEVENVGTYGFTSSVPAGGQAIVGFIGGNRDFPFVLALGHNDHRPVDLKAGESAVYSKFGNEIRLNKDGELVFNSGTDYAVEYTELKKAFDELKQDFNTLVGTFTTHIHTTTATVGATAVPGIIAPTLTQGVATDADMLESKVEKVRI